MFLLVFPSLDPNTIITHKMMKALLQHMIRHVPASTSAAVLEKKTFGRSTTPKELLFYESHIKLFLRLFSL